MSITKKEPEMQRKCKVWLPCGHWHLGTPSWQCSQHVENNTSFQHYCFSPPPLLARSGSLGLLPLPQDEVQAEGWRRSTGRSVSLHKVTNSKAWWQPHFNHRRSLWTVWLHLLVLVHSMNAFRPNWGQLTGQFEHFGYTNVHHQYCSEKSLITSKICRAESAFW